MRMRTALLLACGLVAAATGVVRADPLPERAREIVDYDIRVRR